MSITTGTFYQIKLKVNGDCIYINDDENKEQKTYPLSQLMWRIVSIDNVTDYDLQCWQADQLLFSIKPRGYVKTSGFISSACEKVYFKLSRNVKNTREFIKSPCIVLKGEPITWGDWKAPRDVIIGGKIFRCKDNVMTNWGEKMTLEEKLNYYEGYMGKFSML